MATKTKSKKGAAKKSAKTATMPKGSKQAVKKVKSAAKKVATKAKSAAKKAVGKVKTEVKKAQGPVKKKATALANKAKKALGVSSGSGKSKSTTGSKKKPVNQPIAEEVVTGEDLHLLPATEETQTQNADERKRHEKAFEHQQQIAMQQEQQKVRAALNGRKGMNRRFLGGR